MGGQQPPWGCCRGHCFSDEGDAKGYWVVFFSLLERYIYTAARSADVFGDLERQLAISAEIEANRQAEGKT